MTETTLVGVDDSPAAQGALMWAARYAKDRGGDVLATHVLTYSAEFARDLSLTGLTAWRQQLRRRLAGEWVSVVQDVGVEVRSVVVEDESVDAGLLKLATEHDVGLIVLGAHGRGDLKDRLLGAVTYRVSHRADRPVVIVPADWSGSAA